MIRLVSCTRLGGEQRDNHEEEGDEEWVAAKLDLLRAEAELLRAEAGRLRAEGLMFEDIGAMYKELASKAEAEAFIAQADRTTHEMVQKDICSAKGNGSDIPLVVEKARSEIEREVARNKDLATKLSQRSTFGRQSSGRRDDPRNRRPTVVPEKEVPGAKRAGAGGAGGRSEPFNAIKGATEAMKSELDP